MTRFAHGTVFGVASVDISVGVESDVMGDFASVDISVCVESNDVVEFASVDVSVALFPSFEKICKQNYN